MLSEFDNLSVAAAVGITQDHDWHRWEGVVVVGLFPAGNMQAHAVGFELASSRMLVSKMGVEFTGVEPVADEPLPLENSQRWASKMSHAEAIAGDHGVEHVGKAKVEFCVDLCALGDSLLGVDVGGLFQIWDLLTGRELLEGRFTYKGKYVRMNAICLTPDWVIAATCLDDEGCTSTIFAADIGADGALAPPLTVNVTGIKHLTVDAETPHIVWIATDSGPFFLDTRFPQPMWAILPGGRWIEALGVVDDMAPALQVGRYVSRFDQCTKDLVYRKAMLDSATPECNIEETAANPCPAAGVTGDSASCAVEHCTCTKIADDLKLAQHFNTKRYRLLDADIRPHFIQTARDGQLIAIGEACFSWTSMHDMKIVPGRLGGLLCGAFVPGGLVFVHEDRKIYMVQAPWATRQTDQPDFAEKVIARAFDVGKTSVTRISDAPNVDCNNMVVAVSDTTLLVHAADDGIYRFDVTSEPPI